MSKRFGAVVALGAVLLSQTGCYTTKVVSQARADGPERSDRQWFTIGGLVGLSGEAGRECSDGLSSVESKLSATDWLIGLGAGLAGGIVGYLACGNGTVSSDPNVNAAASFAAKTSCAGIGSSLVPFLISSRTVTYACAEGPNSGRGNNGQDFMPRQGYRAQPPPAGEENAPMSPPPPAPAPAPAR